MLVNEVASSAILLTSLRSSTVSCRVTSGVLSVVAFPPVRVYEYMVLLLEDCSVIAVGSNDDALTVSEKVSNRSPLFRSNEKKESSGGVESGRTKEACTVCPPISSTSLSYISVRAPLKRNRKVLLTFVPRDVSLSRRSRSVLVIAMSTSAVFVTENDKEGGTLKL